MSAPSAPVYEVRCPSCQVTFPVGTRHCMHCGGRTEAPSAREREADVELVRQQLPSGPLDLGNGRGGEEAAGDESPSRWSRGIGLLWVAIVLAVSAYRACTGGGTG